MHIDYFNSGRILPSDDIELVSDFLFKELGQYGDPKISITKAIDYAMDDTISGGGLVAIAYDAGKMIAATVINNTRMGDYIPENILVYIAVHHEYRGQGIGRRLMSEAINYVQGDIALHVEPDNPAIFLYRSLGFTNKYLEMRLKRKEG